MSTYCSGWLVWALFAWQIAGANHTVVLPSSNYWEISQDIVRSADLRLVFEISPGQNQQIKEMRSRVSEMIALERSQLSQAGIRLSAQELYLEFDDIVEAELALILNEEQMAQLRPTMMRVRFKTGCSPFYDLEILGLLKLDAEESKKLWDKLEVRNESLQKKDLESNELVSRRIVEVLPAQAQQRFVDFAGSEFVDGVQPAPQAEQNGIPLHHLEYASHALGLAVANADWQRDAKLTPTEIASLAQAQSQLQERFSLNNMRPGGFKSFSALQEAQEKATYQTLTELLADQQLGSLMRKVANESFVSQPMFWLDKAEFVTYLQLTADELQKVRETAKSELDRHATEMQMLDKQTFKELVRELPESQQGFLTEVFDGVFDNKRFTFFVFPRSPRRGT